MQKELYKILEEADHWLGKRERIDEGFCRLGWYDSARELYQLKCLVEGSNISEKEKKDYLAEIEFARVRYHSGHGAFAILDLEKICWRAEQMIIPDFESYKFETPKEYSDKLMAQNTFIAISKKCKSICKKLETSENIKEARRIKKIKG